MIKRLFDFFMAIILITTLSWLILILLFFSAIATKSNGVFIQERVGKDGHLFNIYKIRSLKMNNKGEVKPSLFGKMLRKTKLDELPQLFNVLRGEMSIVGPRPDISGYYNKLQGENRLILNLKPGLTSLAAIKYMNEEYMLAMQQNPLKYNDEVIFPDKVKMNLEYYYNHSFLGDLKIIWKTIWVFF